MDSQCIVSLIGIRNNPCPAAYTLSAMGPNDGHLFGLLSIPQRKFTYYQ